MSLAVGSRLGTYRILASLGVGGMGEVHRARDLRLGRDVALKVLPDSLSTAREALARFEREARILASLNHPNLVTLYSIEEAEGRRFLTMELVEGQTLAGLIPQDGLPFATVSGWLMPLVEALGAAHGQGVIHRDLKPANVMVTPAGRVKVLDFGVAKLTQERLDRDPAHSLLGTSPLSVDGAVYGTVPYMAPEQIFGETVDARTDLFALGVLAYEALTGRRPFAGESFGQVAAAILRDAPPPLVTSRGDVPDRFVAVVARCLEKASAARFQSAEELLEALLAARNADASRPGTAATPSRERALASVAVLPFANRSTNPGDVYFSDGLADDLLDMLAKIQGLRVSARASSFQFRGKSVSVTEIGRSLNVATLLDGSVRRAENRVRISVQLVNVADGCSLWSETYDRTLDDIFAVQDDIARSVATELRATLLGESRDFASAGGISAEVDKAGRGRSTDPEAHRLYLLARYLIDQYTHDATLQGITYLKEAVEIDPDFALAWSMLSVAHLRAWGLGLSDDGLALAREAVARSIAIEPALAEGHAQLASIRLLHDWDWTGARVSMDRALTLARGSAEVLRLSGVLASALDRPEVAIGILERVLHQDPLNAAASHSLGVALLATDDHPAAEAHFRRALDLAPQRIATRAHLALAKLANGQGETALWEAAREPEPGYRRWAEAIIQFDQGMRERSEATLHQLIAAGADRWGIQIAEVQALRGAPDEAFRWLRHAHAARDPGMAFVRNSPRLRALHRDPRWLEFLRLLGFEG